MTRRTISLFTHTFSYILLPKFQIEKKAYFSAKSKSIYLSTLIKKNSPSIIFT